MMLKTRRYRQAAKTLFAPSRYRTFTPSRLLLRRTILTRAHAKGPTEPPLLEHTVGQHFASIVAEHGDRLAVISRHQNIHLTYEILDWDSNALARGLEKRGVCKGDRVAVSLGNNAEFATLTYALFKLGTILVPLNPAFSASQVISALSHLSASHLIIGLETNVPWKEPRSNVALLNALLPNLYGSFSAADVAISEVVPSLKSVITVDNACGRIDAGTLSSTIRYGEILEDGGDGKKGLQKRNLNPDEIVNIQFTSGTTSMPKAACLSHRSILNNGKSIGDRMLLTPEDIVVCPPPLYHCFGCILGYMATVTHGSCIVFPTEAFNPLSTLQSVQEYSATALYGVPTMFLSELELLSSGAVSLTGFHRLRTGIAAGSSIPEELMRKLHRTLNLTELTICYGMTETSPVSCMTTTDDPLEKRLGTVGRLLPHVECKVVDSGDQRRVLNIGERGELAVKGYLVMRGYWEDEVRTREVMIPDESGEVWMHTGDEAEMDAEGYVKITGRLKDIVIRGGENIHPLDIENCLLGHDAVSDVSACGVPDEKYGEVVAVFLVLHKRANITSDEARAWVRQKLSGHFVPKYVFFTESFPKTPSGKVQRFKLQEEVAQLRKQGKGL